MHLSDKPVRISPARNQIKFFAMSIAPRIDEQIDNLLFCVNGSKKFSVRQNIETKALELIVDDNGNTRRHHKDEEVLYPFHNKAIIESISQGLQSIY